VDEGDSAKGQPVEPLYQQDYLPRKFKIGIALPDDNCVDVHTHDLGLLAVCEENRVVGYNILVGGGMGMTPANKKTFPALARPMAFVEPEAVVDTAIAIVKVFRDFGNRTNRKQARLKYLLAEWGMQRFKQRVEEYYGRRLSMPRSINVRGVDDHLGWHPQGDGRWFLGLSVENGRITDGESVRWKSALREVFRTLGPNVRLTPQQNLLLIDLEDWQLAIVEEILCHHGVERIGRISNVRRWSMACVALPTCPLAITEGERAMPGIIDALESELVRLELGHEEFTVRMTGCPNGCARPYNADVGLVGRGLGKYAVFLGGGRLGDRLGFLHMDKVPLAQIVPALVPLLTLFKHQRWQGESFGDFCHRNGPGELAACLTRQAHKENVGSVA